MGHDINEELQIEQLTALKNLIEFEVYEQVQEAFNYMSNYSVIDFVQFVGS